MKKHFITFYFTAIVSAQDNKEQSKSQIVEAACGQCQFGKGYGCELAVRIDGNLILLMVLPLIPMVMHIMMVLCRY
jgi:uncharacterized membrane protein